MPESNQGAGAYTPEVENRWSEETNLWETEQPSSYVPPLKVEKHPELVAQPEQQQLQAATDQDLDDARRAVREAFELRG